MKTPTVVFALTLMLCGDARAQFITGTVMDTASNTRVAAARVILLQVDSSQSVVTDSTGNFRFRALPGIASLRITALGYADLSSHPFLLEKDDRYTLLIYMSATPVEVMPIHVIAKSRRPPTALEQFEERRKSSGSGHFLDAKALARMYATETTDYLRRIAGVIVERDYVRMRAADPNCGEPIFVVDGIEFKPPEFGGPYASELVNSFVSPNEIAAIEVYKEAVPPEIQSGLSVNWACGVVVIWTKQRAR